MADVNKTLDDKIADAQHRIEDLYHQTNGKCYLSFSGGKDSYMRVMIQKDNRSDR